PVPSCAGAGGRHDSPGRGWGTGTRRPPPPIPRRAPRPPAPAPAANTAPRSNGVIAGVTGRSAHRESACVCEVAGRLFEGDPLRFLACCPFAAGDACARVDVRDRAEIPLAELVTLDGAGPAADFLAARRIPFCVHVFYAPPIDT